MTVSATASWPEWAAAEVEELRAWMHPDLPDLDREVEGSRSATDRSWRVLGVVTAELDELSSLVGRLEAGVEKMKAERVDVDPDLDTKLWHARKHCGSVALVRVAQTFAAVKNSWAELLGEDARELVGQATSAVLHGAEFKQLDEFEQAWHLTGLVWVLQEMGVAASRGASRSLRLMALSSPWEVTRRIGATFLKLYERCYSRVVAAVVLPELLKHAHSVHCGLPRNPRHGCRGRSLCRALTSGGPRAP